MPGREERPKSLRFYYNQAPNDLEQFLRLVEGKLFISARDIASTHSSRYYTIIGHRDFGECGINLDIQLVDEDGQTIPDAFYPVPRIQHLDDSEFFLK